MPSTNYGISFGSTAGNTMSYMSSNTYLAMDTGTSNMWMTSSDPIPYTPTPEPEEDFEFCKWCNAEWFPSEFYPGNCVSCGGPRKFTYTRRTME